jgi:hypothetical protein
MAYSTNDESKNQMEKHSNLLSTLVNHPATHSHDNLHGISDEEESNRAEKHFDLFHWLVLVLTTLIH